MMSEGLQLDAKNIQPNVKVYFSLKIISSHILTFLIYIVSYSSFDLKPKCLQGTAEKKKKSVGLDVSVL